MSKKNISLEEIDLSDLELDSEPESEEQSSSEESSSDEVEIEPDSDIEIELDSDIEIEQDLIEGNLKESPKGSIDDKNNALNIQNEKKESKYTKPLDSITGIKLISVKDSSVKNVIGLPVEFFDDLEKTFQFLLA